MITYHVLNLNKPTFKVLYHRWTHERMPYYHVPNITSSHDIHDFSFMWCDELPMQHDLFVYTMMNARWPSHGIKKQRERKWVDIHKERWTMGYGGRVYMISRLISPSLKWVLQHTHTTRTHYNIIMLHFTPRFVPSTSLLFLLTIFTTYSTSSTIWLPPHPLPLLPPLQRVQGAPLLQFPLLPLFPLWFPPERESKRNECNKKKKYDKRKRKHGGLNIKTWFKKH